ncbi:MAG TPA: hypothetical protein VNH53_08425 [Sphingomicrobium sp.]|nr:hypothetical protein [Sphingomicrobium sp.]
MSRLASLTNNLSGTANDLASSFTYNPASQIASMTRSDAYAARLVIIGAARRARSGR